MLDSSSERGPRTRFLDRSMGVQDHSADHTAHRSGSDALDRSRQGSRHSRGGVQTQSRGGADDHSRGGEAAQEGAPLGERRRSRASASPPPPDDPHQLSKRREDLEERQHVLAELKAQFEARSESGEMGRIVEAARTFGRHARMVAVAIPPSGEQDGAQAELGVICEDERARVAALSLLYDRLVEVEARQYRLRGTLNKRLRQQPAAGDVSQHVRQLQQHPDVRREYDALVKEHIDTVRLHQLTEQLMYVSDYTWVDSDSWMRVIRPRYHSLRPPMHVLRSDVNAAAAAAADASSTDDQSRVSHH